MKEKVQRKGLNHERIVIFCPFKTYLLRESIDDTFSTTMSSPNASTAAASATKPMTPLRNNYAAPNTPIASVKRPRQSIERTPVGKLPPSTPLRVAQMSPMHPPKPVENMEEETTSWVGRKVDALFSPVLHMFSSTGATVVAEDHVVTDEDITMEEDKQVEIQEQGQGQLKLYQQPGAEEPYLDPSMTATNEDPEPLVVTKSTLSCDDEGDLEEDPSSDDDEDDFNPYLFIKSLPRYEAVRHLRPNIALPPKDPRDPPVTLVLDLDETLVHCTVEACHDADLTFPVVFHGIAYQVHVRLRPYLFDFLEAIHDKFEVVVFTASQRVYADELLDRIDPSTLYLYHLHTNVAFTSSLY